MATRGIAYLDNPLMYTTAISAVALQRTAVEATAIGQALPDAVRQWLARLRLLEGVPFAHLVPDSELLPEESIRFFYVDREWTDALVQGALSVSTLTTLDREAVQAIHARIRTEVDAEERRVRMVGGENVGFAQAGTISGFLLRSRAVSGWPAIHVRAYGKNVGPDDAKFEENHPDRIRLLRLERLAPAVLLCLIDGVPQTVHIEEPRQGVQFGVDLPDDGSGRVTIDLRDVTTARKISRPPVDVPFRKDAPGVIHMKELAKIIEGEAATNVHDFGGTGMEGAEFAIEMLQFPYRQVFGDPARSTEPGAKTLTYEDVFRPTVQMDDVRAWEA